MESNYSDFVMGLIWLIVGFGGMVWSLSRCRDSRSMFRRMLDMLFGGLIVGGTILCLYLVL